MFLYDTWWFDHITPSTHFWSPGVSLGKPYLFPVQHILDTVCDVIFLIFIYSNSIRHSLIHSIYICKNLFMYLMDTLLSTIARPSNCVPSPFAALFLCRRSGSFPNNARRERYRPKLCRGWDFLFLTYKNFEFLFIVLMAANVPKDPKTEVVSFLS